jgi:hypothetical protein
MVKEIHRPKEPKIILPTCCVCQKIRDEQGNWHERSEYQADYQGVLFTHTICHECALKLYPEFYEGMQQEVGMR